MATDLRRPNRTFTIRQLCLEFKCTPRALRFYEDKGLISPARDGMNRVYSYKDRARLQLILRGKRVGLALAEIGQILEQDDPVAGRAIALVGHGQHPGTQASDVTRRRHHADLGGHLAGGGQRPQRPAQSPS